MGNQINCNSCGYNINQELHIQLIRNNVIVNTQEPRISMGKETKNNRVSKFKKYSKKKTSLSRNVMVKTLSELTNHTSNTSINIIKFKYNNYIYIGCSSQSREIINGFGIAYNDFARYVGEFDSNLAKGIGRFENENEDKIFIGEFDNNKANGYGQLITSSKTEFEGYWKNDSQYCEGTETWIDGSKYKGCYVNGIKSGIGTYKWPDGSWYQGEWMNEEIHGWGIYSFNDGRIYKGNWSNNQKNGNREYIFEEGKRYIGNLKKEKKHGFGIYFWPTSNQPTAYAGMWKEGKMEGYGVVYKGNILRYCNYKNGKREKIYPNENEFWKEARKEVGNIESQFKYSMENIEGIFYDVDDDIGVN